MADMSKFAKADSPAQTKGRLVWILDAIRANQIAVSNLLRAVDVKLYTTASLWLSELEKSDRDALLQPEGIFTPEQLKGIKNAVLMASNQTPQTNK